MRGNTAPPPSVRLGAEPRPADNDPISTSRPRNEGDIPVLDKPPADMLASIEAAKRADPEPTTKTPAVAASAAPSPPSAQEPLPPPRAPLPTLLSAAESRPSPRVETQTIEEEEGPALSQPAPSVSPRSLSGAPGAFGAVRRKGRGSNLRSSGKSTPPPSMASVAPSPASEAPRPAMTETPLAPVEVTAKAAGVASAPPASTSDKPADLVVPSAKGEEASPRSGKDVPHSKDMPHSVAPPSDLDEFFLRGDRQHHDGPVSHADDGSDLDAYDPRMAHKNTPEARARREKNWGYVKVAGGFCVVLMAAGLIRSRMAPVEEPGPPVVVTVVGPTAPTVAAAPKVEPPPVPVASAMVPAGSAEPVGSAAPGEVASAAASGSAGPAASAPIPVTAAEDLPTAPAGSGRFQEPVVPLGTAAKGTGVDPASGAVAVPVALAAPTDAEKKSAVQEKRACSSFLDQGAFVKAVDAGEKSVALDPTDGEAWLMLGAAYQSMGKTAEARRSFSSCVAEGKKGPIGECRAMLR